MGVPEGIDPVKAQYVWIPQGGSTATTDCEILKTNPLVLRALPRGPRLDGP